MSNARIMSALRAVYLIKTCAKRTPLLDRAWRFGLWLRCPGGKPGSGFRSPQARAPRRSSNGAFFVPAVYGGSYGGALGRAAPRARYCEPCMPRHPLVSQ